ncbi:hypothetical protein HMPREF1152_0085 [Mogibacterium sp. CM50]|nr:hypothetical protein HMPREF1152_0085 [Mogibacterium sp. CM50]
MPDQTSGRGLIVTSDCSLNPQIHDRFNEFDIYVEGGQ